MAEYEALVSIKYDVQDSEIKKLSDATKGKQIVIGVETDTKEAKNELKALQKEFESLKKIIGATGSGANFSNIVNQLQSAIIEIKGLSKEIGNLQKNSVLSVNVDEFNKLSDIVNNLKGSKILPNPLEGTTSAAKDAVTAINEVQQAQKELFDSDQLKAYDLDLLNLKPELRKQEMNEIKDYARQMYKDIKDLGDKSTGYEDDHIWGIKKSGEYVNISDAIKEGAVNARELEKLLSNISYLYQTGGWSTIDTQIGEHPQYTERNDPLFESRLKYMQQYEQLVQVLHGEESALRIEEKMSDEEKLQRQQEILKFEELINNPALLTQKLAREKEISAEIEKHSTLLKSMTSPFDKETDVYSKVDWDNKPREENLKLIAEDDIRRQQEQLAYLEQRKQIELELVALGKEYNSLELPNEDFASYTGFSEGIQKIDGDVNFAQQRISDLTDNIKRYDAVLKDSAQNATSINNSEATAEAIKSETQATEQLAEARRKAAEVESPKDITAPETIGFEKTNAVTDEHIKLMEQAAQAELEKLEISKQLANALLDEEGALKAVATAAEKEAEATANSGNASEEANKKKSTRFTSKSKLPTDTTDIKKELEELILLEEEYSKYQIARSRAKTVAGSDDRTLSIELYNKETEKAIKLSYDYDAKAKQFNKTTQEEINNHKQLADLKERSAKADEKLISSQTNKIAKLQRDLQDQISAYSKGGKKVSDTTEIDPVRKQLEDTLKSVQDNYLSKGLTIPQSVIISLDDYLASLKRVVKEQKELQYAGQLSQTRFDDSKAKEIEKVNKYLRDQTNLTEENTSKMKGFISEIKKAGDASDLKHISNQFELLKDKIDNSIRSFKNVGEIDNLGLLRISEKSKSSIEEIETNLIKLIPGAQEVAVKMSSAFDKFHAKIKLINGDVQDIDFSLANIEKSKKPTFVQEGDIITRSSSTKIIDNKEFKAISDSVNSQVTEFNKLLDTGTKAYQGINDKVVSLKSSLDNLSQARGTDNEVKVHKELDKQLNSVINSIVEYKTNLKTIDNKAFIELESSVNRQMQNFEKLNSKANGYSRVKTAVDDLAAVWNNLESAYKTDNAEQQAKAQNNLNVQLAHTKKLITDMPKFEPNKDFVSNLESFAKQAKNVFSQKIVNDEQFDVAKVKLKALEDDLVKLQDLGVSGNQLEQAQVAFDKAKLSVDSYVDSVEKAAVDIDKINNDIKDFIKNSSAAVQDPTLGPQIQALKDMGEAYAKAATPEKKNELANELTRIKSEARGAGLNVLTFGDLVERTFKRLGAYVIANTIMSGLRDQLSKLYNNVVEIDFAMKDLERVSGATGQELSQAFEKSGDMAIRLGSSIKDVLGSVRDWTRLGLSIEDSLMMAESTALLASVGVMGLDRATEGLVSTTRAYNIEAKDTLSLVDKIVATDISQAISSEGILDVLQRSSAALASANSSLEENIALGTAINTVLQSSEKSGTALNAMVMRLRNTSGALKEMGEDTDGTFESITKLQQRIYELTNQKVDIFIDEDTFDSVYNTIQGISKEWGNLSDKAQAEITQILGGTRQAQAISALISQFHIAEDAMESMGQSSGKALELNNVIMDTASKKAEQLGASFEKLSQSAIDTTLVKGGLDVLRGLVDVITTINNSTGGLLSVGAAISVLFASFKELNQKFDFGKTFQDIGKQAA